ncbi:MAG: TonB-dependent receptor [Nevskia sp.]|nr:TonB-dependent receptor [Nevskia sp.]
MPSSTHAADRWPALQPIRLAVAIGLFFAVPTALRAAEPSVPETPATAADSTAEATDSEVKKLSEVLVTGTRRNETVQKVPINIFSLSGEQIRAQGLTDLSDYTKQVPGLFLVDQGARAANQISVRGLNVTSVAASEAVGNGSGDVVSTYIGDIPLYLDLKLLDIDRVETLLGPQGTLYGAGTLGGAIRYLPNRPDPSQATLSVSQNLYGQSQSAGIGSESTAVINLPLASNAALRASLGFFHGPGFIDYPFVLREPGVSDPEPDRNDPAAVAANLKRNKDADSENTLAGRIGGLYKFGEVLTANLTYFYQRQAVGARTINNTAAFDTGHYESGQRYDEPNRRRNQLLSLELIGDLGFATLTSATGLSRYDERGQRDQTDLLLSFEYGYEDFPAFSAFTLEKGREERLSQELRLVSTGDGPFTWIGGLFYNTAKSQFESSELVPGFPEYAEIDRPDNLEYFSSDDTRFTDKAIFGELGYQLTPAWQLTAGGRYFRFRQLSNSGFALPLIDGSAPDEVAVTEQANGVADSGFIFKFNTSYQFRPDVLGYATLSQGYRSGGVNSVPPCLDPLPEGQNVCALPNEVLIKPDKTLNHELGLKTAWFGGRLTINGDVYYIDWKDVQVGGRTVNGEVPITVNGARATSQGFELAVLGRIDQHWSLAANYSYNDARLSRDSPNILVGEASLEGDRLPGSPINQGSLRVTRADRLSNGWRIETSYGINALDGVLTRVGGRDNGERLGGYTLHRADLSITDGRWRFRLYGNNLFDKYAETGVRASKAGIGTIGPNNFTSRRYYKDVLPPRIFGATFSYDFTF